MIWRCITVEMRKLWQSDGDYKVSRWPWRERNIERLPSQTLGLGQMDIGRHTELDFTVYSNGALPGTGPQAYTPALRSYLNWYRICKAASQGVEDSICKARGLTHGRGCYYGNYCSDPRTRALPSRGVQPSPVWDKSAKQVWPFQGRGPLVPQTPQLGLQSQWVCTEPFPNHLQGHRGNWSSQMGRKVWKRDWRLVYKALKIYGLGSS